MEQLSQVSCIGRPQPRTWDDYAEGCLGTFAGGYRGNDLEIFRHGMGTVFNLLRGEFPPAEQCQASRQMLAVLKAVSAELRNRGTHDWFPVYVRIAVDEAIEKAEGA